MNETELIHLYPTFPVIAESMVGHFPEVRVSIRDIQAQYHAPRRYRGQKLEKNIVYVITAQDADVFPVNEYAYISGDSIPGEADHICISGQTSAGLLERLLDLFLEFQEIENRIVGLLYQNGQLRDLCALGEELMGNPICLHDSWFMILARSRSTDAFLPESEGGWEVFPQHFLDEFRLDAEYVQTYEKQGVQLWEGILDGKIRHTLYVNLNEKGTFRGRLLITDSLRPFLERDRMVARLLAHHALLLMTGSRSTDISGHRGTDEILLDILNGKYVPAPEFSVLLRTLHWEKNHRFLCIRLQRQDAADHTPGDHVLHRELFLVFPDSYILYTGTQQCVILNLTRTPASSAQVRHMLSPLCRDYYQYGGISSPVEGIRELPIAFHQAQEALDRAFRMRNERWIVRFHECAMEYVLTHLHTPMQLRHLVAPQLLELMEYDRRKGSQLFETFRVYLDHERDIPGTAAKLIIHRTTLTYRLKKIASIVDLNLDDPDVRLYLRLSLKMLEQEKTVKLSEEL